MNDIYENETQAQRVTRLRNEAGLSQTQLAVYAGLRSMWAITKLESGKAGFNQESTLAAVAKVLNVTPDYLACKERYPKKVNHKSHNVALPSASNPMMYVLKEKESTASYVEPADVDSSLLELDTGIFTPERVEILKKSIDRINRLIVSPGNAREFSHELLDCAIDLAKILQSIEDESAASKTLTSSTEKKAKCIYTDVYISDRIAAEGNSNANKSVAPNMQQPYQKLVSREEFESIYPLLYENGRKPRSDSSDKYPHFNAVLYVLNTGCTWRALPEEYPLWNTVYSHWKRWSETDSKGLSKLDRALSKIGWAGPRHPKTKTYKIKHN